MADPTANAIVRMQSCPELLEIIFSQLNNKRDLKTLCLTSKLFNPIATRLLYREICLPIDDKSLDYVDLRRIPDYRNENMCHVRAFTVHAPWRVAVTGRRHSHGPDGTERIVKRELEYQEALRAHGAGIVLRRMELELKLLLKNTSTKLLRKFHWLTGSHSAKQFAWIYGKFMAGAPLEDLAFIFCSGCTRQDHQDRYAVGPFRDLLQKPTLRRLKWIGIERWQDVSDFIKPYLELERPALRILELEILDFEYIKSGLKSYALSNIDDEDSFFVKHILGLKAGSRKVLFPQLQTLRLRGIPFGNMQSEALAAFNFANLDGLHLDYAANSQPTDEPSNEEDGWCGPTDFTGLIAENGSLRLKELELKYSEELPLMARDGTLRFGEGSKIVSDLLQHTAHLRILRLHVYESDNPLSWRYLEDAVMGLLPQLEEIILHAQLYRPYLADSYVLRSVMIPWHNAMPRMLRTGTRLKRLGISAFPYKKDLESQNAALEGIPPSQLEMLHFRLGHSVANASLALGGGIQHGWMQQRYYKDSLNGETRSPEKFRLLTKEVIDRFATAHKYHWKSVPSGQFDDARLQVEESLELISRLPNLPRLEAICLGDFSHEGRLGRRVMDVFYRSGKFDLGNALDANAGQDIDDEIPSFRAARVGDSEIWDLIRSKADFVGAMPMESIYPYKLTPRFPNEPFVDSPVPSENDDDGSETSDDDDSDA